MGFKEGCDYIRGILPASEKQRRRRIAANNERERRLLDFDTFMLTFAVLGLLAALFLLVFGAWRLLLWVVAG